MHFFVEIVRGQVASWRQSSGGWVIGNCPVCVRMGEPRPDRKRRGGFQFGEDEWVYHCFNCKFKTGWSQGNQISQGARILLNELGMDTHEIHRINIRLMQEQETAQLLNPLPKERPRFVPNWEEIELPDGSQSISHYEIDEAPSRLLAALAGLNERKLTHWTDWFYCGSDFKMSNRLILPYRYQGRIVGYNAGYFGKRNMKIPKYLLKKPQNFIFNLDRQNSDRDVMVVMEGDYDAISMDGVSLGTNSLSENQADLLNQYRQTKILLPDADLSGNNLIEPAIENGWHVSFPEWMEYYKDANQAAIKMGRTFVLKSVIKSAIDNPTKIRVLAKKYLK